jgi:DNA-binding response OmpR family regulator
VAESLIYTIDDDVDFNMLLKMTLKSYNIQVVTHTNADDFTKSVKLKLPDLCILDLNLDTTFGSEGFQLLGAMRNVLGNKLPIFIMSKRGDSEDVLKAMDLGANDFVPKPLDDKYLLSKLKTFLPDNGELKDLDIHFSGIAERDKSAEITAKFKLLRLSLEEMEVESDIFLTKEMNLYFEGDILQEVFNNPRMNFKVIDSQVTDDGPCRAKLEKELSHEELFSLRRWLVRKKLETLSNMSASEQSEEI